MSSGIGGQIDIGKALQLETQKREPWRCPGCKAYNAPHVDRCNCHIIQQSYARLGDTS